MPWLDRRESPRESVHFRDVEENSSPRVCARRTGFSSMRVGRFGQSASLWLDARSKDAPRGITLTAIAASIANLPKANSGLSAVHVHSRAAIGRLSIRSMACALGTISNGSRANGWHLCGACRDDCILAGSKKPQANDSTTLLRNCLMGAGNGREHETQMAMVYSLMAE